MDVKRASRKARGVSMAAPPLAEQQHQQVATPSVEPKAAGKASSWKHDLHRSFARVRLDLAPSLVHVWEIMWDHLPSSNRPFHVSDGTIAREAGFDRSAATNALNELIRLGLIVCISRGYRGNRTASVWRFPQSLPSVPKRPRRTPPKRQPD